MRKPVRIFALMLILCLILSGCSGDVSDKSTDTDSGYNSEEYQEEDGGASMSVQSVKGAEDAGDVSDEDYQREDTNTAENTQDINTGEKLVYTCDISIETTAFQNTVDQIKEMIKDYKGIIESQEDYENEAGSYQNKYSTLVTNLTVKVPANDYENFLNDLKGKGKITHRNMNVTNISRSYYDTSATVEALEIQEKRLLDMMKQAKTIDDMIAVEKRLTEVQTQLNQNKTNLSAMDTEVAYSTITLNIQEVLEYKNNPEKRKTNKFIDRLINELKDSWKGFLFFMENMLFLVIRLLPFAVFAGIALCIIIPIQKKFGKKKPKKREPKRTKKQEIKKKTEEPEQPVVNEEEMSGEDKTEKQDTGI